MREFMWCSIVESPAFAYYVTNGYLSSEDLNMMRSKRDDIRKQFDGTLAKVPLRVHIKNNGSQATTIETVEIFVPVIDKKDPLVANDNVKTHVEPSKVDDLEYGLQIPVIFLMYGEIIDWAKRFASPETPASVNETILNAVKPQLEAAPFISLDSKGTVIVTDQLGTKSTGSFDLRPISDLLEKARSPESKEAESTQSTAG
jgi:hypothetical protein